MKITRRSQATGVEHTLDLDVTEDQLERFTRRGMMVQDAFPHLSASDREFILTGITAEEWNKLFPPEEEE